MAGVIMSWMFPSPPPCHGARSLLFLALLHPYTARPGAALGRDSCPSDLGGTGVYRGVLHYMRASSIPGENIKLGMKEELFTFSCCHLNSRPFSAAFLKEVYTPTILLWASALKMISTSLQHASPSALPHCHSLQGGNLLPPNAKLLSEMSSGGY